MQQLLRLLSLFNLALSCAGCFRAPTDITTKADYQFQSFADTVWKTKEKTAIATINQGFPKHDYHLLSAKNFVTSHPDYQAIHQCEVVAELPVGTHLRIDRLLKDNNNWGGVYVVANIESGPHAGKSVTVRDDFLAKNRFDSDNAADPAEWTVKPEMLEKAE